MKLLKKELEKVSLNSQQSHFLLETIALSGNARDYAMLIPSLK
ncbi:MAG: hypothetical protein V8S94_01485 [Methanobrevibacter smithii]